MRLLGIELVAAGLAAALLGGVEDLAACLQRGCPGAFMKFTSPTAAVAPDFSPIAKRAAWVHRPLAADFAYAIDPEGPAYLVFVAMDALSKRRVLATASWTEASGARFAWAPPEIAKLGSDVVIAEPRAGKGRASFSVFGTADGPAARPFTLSFDDFMITFFTAGPGSTTLPLVVYGMVRKAVEPTINAISTIILLVTTVAVVGAELLRKEPDTHGV